MKKILTFLILSSFSVSSFSQGIDINSNKDVTDFLGAYFSPISESVGAGLNQGWYNTAKPHKLAGFDVSFNLNIITINDKLSKFDVNNLENFTSSSNSTPTILGSGNGATIAYEGQTFVMPNQTVNLKFIPMPTLNAGIGLFKGTELNFRYIPTLKYKVGFAGEGSIKIYGFGLKHDILQWLPLQNILPFDLSIQGSYSKVSTSFQVESQSDKQDVSFEVKASNFNIILSKKFSALTAYASIGQSIINSTFNTITDFKIGSSSTLDFNITENIDMPITSNFQAATGIRLQLAIFSVFANQTFSNYPITSAGVGISFR